MRATPLLFTLLSAPALAAPTVLQLNPDDDGAPYVADYSQAVLVKARLLRADGEPIAGERVTFTLRHGDDAESELVFGDPVSDAEGYASARLTLVDGRHGGRTFVGAAPTLEVAGERYLLGARFQGDPFAEDCDTDGGPLPDGGADPDLCDAADEGELFVALETSTLVVQPGIEVELGGAVPIIATLTDENGDAEQAGTDPDGVTAKPLAERRVGFFYDVNGNGNPENAERIPCAGSGESFALTDENGRAVCDFFADPSYVDTVNVEEAIHAQFGGDAQYSLSGAAQALTVRAAAPRAEATLLEATPASAPANGFSLVEVRATLVDSANNTLGADDPLYDVRFETDLGTFESDAERDPLTGNYLASLKAPTSGGDATVRVVVEDVPGATVTVEFLQQGCTCAAGSRAGGPGGALWLSGALLFFLWRVRARRTDA